MIFAGYKVSELAHFAIGISDSLWRLQGRRIVMPGTKRRPASRQKEHGEIQVQSSRTGSSPVHQAW